MEDIQDARHWSNRSESRTDEVHDAFEHALQWVLTHRRQAAWTAGGAAVLVVILGLFFYSRQARTQAAWSALSQAEAAFYSGRPQDAQAPLARVYELGNPAVSGLARLLEGDMHYPRGEYEQALNAYDQAAQEMPEALKPYALADKAAALEAAGKPAECAAAAQAWLSAYPEHLLAPMVHAGMARCLAAAGQGDAARSALQKITLQYPDTPWADRAGAGLQPAPKPNK